MPTQQQIITDCFNPLIATGNGEKGKSPGILVGVTYQGTPSYYSFGQVPVMQAGATTATENIAFFIGSNTKVFTATLLALASYVDPPPNIPINGFTEIISLLPSTVPSHQWQDKPIMLWHLATHSAGYPDGLCGEGPNWGDYAFGKTSDFLNAFTPGYQPGYRWHYSNQGFALLGVLLAHAYTGAPNSGVWDSSYLNWPFIVTNNVLWPLGLMSTQVGYNAGDMRRLAQCFAYKGEGQPYVQDTIPIVGLDSSGLGAGALTSTLADMMTFLNYQITPPAGTLGDAIKLTQQDQGEGLSMGLGWQIGKGYFEKNGLVIDYASYMAFDPTSGYGIFAMANSIAGDDGGALCTAGLTALGELINNGTSSLQPPQFPTPPLCLKPDCP